MAQSDPKARFAKRIDRSLALDSIAKVVAAIALAGIFSSMTLVAYGHAIPTEATDRLFNPGTGQVPIYSPRGALQVLVVGVVLAVFAAMLYGLARLAMPKTKR